MPETVAITQARDRAEKAYSAAQDLLKAHASPDAEQLKAIDAFMNDFDSAKREMDTLLRVSVAEKAFSDPSYKTPRGPGLPEGVSLDTEPNAAQMKAALYNRAFAKSLRKAKDHIQLLSADEQKALSSIAAGDGGIATSEDFQNRLITRMSDLLTIRQRATIISTNSASVGFPAFDLAAIDADITLEGETAGIVDVANILGKVSFTPFKRSRVFKAPEELIEDMDFDVIKLVADQLAIRFAEVEENEFLNGDGASKALGVLKSGIGTVDCESSATITGNDVMGLPYEVRQVYRAGGIYMTHRTTLKKIRLLRDDSGAATGTGQFLWQPSLVAGQPSTLNGYPIVESEWFPNAFGTSGADGMAALLFGDWAQYWIIDRKQFSMRVLDQLYAAEGKVGYQCTRRYDGAPVILEAFKALVRNDVTS